ncbi:lithocholate 6-beta-hydroxylase-like [Rhipicephalus sanguineus]|uniref:lithocholate 6-beta-hydroxylase-like n=1 Tax=Rhipicephalus sanguineus TaxID=34632 RepID=UPI0020C31C9B|nr:lithocholate 6-beta-hydroxylase-like [Rhipicephalus sanguineus]
MFELESASVLVSVVVLICYAIGRWLIRQRKKCFEAFEGTGVPSPPLRSLINGNTDEFLKPSQIESLGRWLKEYGDVFGFHLGDIPFVVVKDPEMISEIFAKEFNNFNDRGHLLRIHEFEPILERNIVLIGGRQWKATRTCMQQFFTPAKLKVVMPALLDAQREFLNILGEGADSGVEMDIGSRCERFTFDVISKSGFNLDTQVQRSPDNPLFQKALRCFPGIMSGFMYSLALNLYHWPRVFKMLHKLFGYFFTNPLVEMTKYAAEIIKFRHQNPQVDVPDMAQLLLDDALGKSNSETKKNEVPQTNAVPLSQEKLYELSTNCMDVFLGGSTTRCAAEDYRYGKYLIKKGTSVMVPTYQLHHDPLYWTDPEKFDPDRFSPENKHLIKPGVYQPFGLGIRACIGQRLALLEMASVTSQVLGRFRITHGPSQKLPRKTPPLPRAPPLTSRQNKRRNPSS